MILLSLFFISKIEVSLSQGITTVTEPRTTWTPVDVTCTNSNLQVLSHGLNSDVFNVVSLEQLKNIIKINMYSMFFIISNLQIKNQIKK